MKIATISHWHKLYFKDLEYKKSSYDYITHTDSQNKYCNPCSTNMYIYIYIQTLYSV